MQGLKTSLKSDYTIIADSYIIPTFLVVAAEAFLPGIIKVF